MTISNYSDEFTNSPLPYKVTLCVLLLATMLTVMAGSVITPVVDAIRIDLDISGTAAGLILTMHGLTIAIFSPMAGWFIDRFGVRIPLIIGLILYSVSGSMGLVSSSYATLIISRCFFGIGAAFIFTGTTVALFSIYQGDLSARVMGLRTMAINVGGIIFPLIGGYLATLFTWHATFGIYLIGVPIALGIFLLVRDTETEKNNRVPSRLSTNSLSYPDLVAIYVLIIIQSVMLYSLAVFLPQFLSTIGYHLPIYPSLYMALLSAASGVIGLLFNRLSNSVGRTVLLRMSLSLWFLGFFILGENSNIFWIGVSVILIGVANALVFSITSLHLGKIVPHNLLGRAMAIFSSCMFLGQFISPIIFGAIIRGTTIASGYITLSYCSLAILIVFSIYKKKRQK